jgi:hypothetical protein
LKITTMSKISHLQGKSICCFKKVINERHLITCNMQQQRVSKLQRNKREKKFVQVCKTAFYI